MQENGAEHIFQQFNTCSDLGISKTSGQTGITIVCISDISHGFDVETVQKEKFTAVCVDFRNKPQDEMNFSLFGNFPADLPVFLLLHALEKPSQ